jgi:hypothetical protein
MFREREGNHLLIHCSLREVSQVSRSVSEIAVSSMKRKQN